MNRSHDFGRGESNLVVYLYLDGDFLGLIFHLYNSAMRIGDLT